MTEYPGIYGKYKVTRHNGDPVDGQFFVLKYSSDPAARIALRAYAHAVKTTNPVLANDIMDILRAYKDEGRFSANDVEAFRMMLAFFELSIVEALSAPTQSNQRRRERELNRIIDEYANLALANDSGKEEATL